MGVDRVTAPKTPQGHLPVCFVALEKRTVAQEWPSGSTGPYSSFPCCKRTCGDRRKPVVVSGWICGAELWERPGAWSRSLGALRALTRPGYSSWVRPWGGWSRFPQEVPMAGGDLGPHRTCVQSELGWNHSGGRRWHGSCGMETEPVIRAAWKSPTTFTTLFCRN